MYSDAKAEHQNHTLHDILNLLSPEILDFQGANGTFRRHAVNPGEAIHVWDDIYNKIVLKNKLLNIPKRENFYNF
jgi:hypothetical protein